MGLGGWWSCEVAGSKGTFCIENCIEKLTYWPAPSPARSCARPESHARDTDTGIKEFNETFPRRIHAFLEDVTQVFHASNCARRAATPGDPGVHLGGHRVLPKRRRPLRPKPLRRCMAIRKPTYVKGSRSMIKLGVNSVLSKAMTCTAMRHIAGRL